MTTIADIFADAAERHHDPDRSVVATIAGSLTCIAVALGIPTDAPLTDDHIVQLYSILDALHSAVLDLPTFDAAPVVTSTGGTA